MNKAAKRSARDHRDMLARCSVGPVGPGIDNPPMDGFPYADTRQHGATSSTSLTGLQSVPQDMGIRALSRSGLDPTSRQIEGLKRGTGPTERLALRNVTRKA